MPLNTTQIPEKENAVRRLKRKINELIETASNGGNHGRLIINRDISHESATTIAQLNILADANVIEQVARSTFQHKGSANEGELDVEIVENRMHDHNKSNPNPKGKSSPKRKHSKKQRKVTRLLRLVKQAAYYGKRRRFTLKYKLRDIKFLDAINAISGKHQNQRPKDNNDHAVLPASERGIHDKIVNKFNNQKNNVIHQNIKLVNQENMSAIHGIEKCFDFRKKDWSVSICVCVILRLHWSHDCGSSFVVFVINRCDT